MNYCFADSFRQRDQNLKFVVMGETLIMVRERTCPIDLQYRVYIWPQFIVGRVHDKAN